ncbi:MAG: hypothetical protein AUH85_00445 [Chloroflexi bacterium 13_1_40CM_4_68_4]|nr:MAG: hypothetical protein AUH85_00445 [Chloroflexi bacterium 13_1_40CM_4_68_4]
MTTFVDTSGLLAFLDDDDQFHSAAALFMNDSRASDEQLLTHDYLVVEAAALVGRRLGAVALRGLLVDIVPQIEVVLVDEALHAQIVAVHLAALPRRTSLVDLASFAIMRERGVNRAFAYDEDFVRAGFDLVRPARRE